MARKNERGRSGAPSSGRKTTSGARGRKASPKGSTRAAGAARKRAGAKKKTAGGARKAAGSRKTGGRKTAGRKAEAREMTSARRPKRAAPKRRGRAVTRRATSGRTPSRGRTTRRPGARQSRAAGRYSDSTRRALWIESPEQQPERPGQTLATRNHDVIRQWAEERGGQPATIAGTEHEGRPGVLRFDFPDYAGGGRLRPVDWDEWFETFDQRNLVFLFQEQMKDGRQSNFFRLDSPDREEG